MVTILIDDRDEYEQRQKRSMHDSIVEYYKAGRTTDYGPRLESLRRRRGESRKANAPSPGSQPNSQSSKPTKGKFGDTGHYVTIGGHPVFITSGGQINRGPRHMKGKHESEVTGKREGRKRRKAKSGSGSIPEATGTPGAFAPRSRLDSRIVEAIGTNGSGASGSATTDDVQHFKELLDDAYQMVSSEAEEVNDDLRNLLSQFGYTGKRVNGFQATARRAKDHTSIVGFDEMADYARQHYPSLLVQDQGDAATQGDHEQMLLDRIRRGFDKQLSKASPEVMQLASDMFERSAAPSDDTDDVGDYVGKRVEIDPNDPFSDFVPFSATSTECFGVGQ